MRAGKRLAPLVFAVGCAAQDGGEPPPSPPQAADAPVSRPVEASLEQRAEADGTDDELGLAEYERMLAEKEDRLRSVGVLVAARELQRDTRYAPPPPAAPADEDTAALGGGSKSKRASSGSGAGQRPAPTRRPTTSSTSTSRAEPQPAPDSKPASAPKPKADAHAAEAESGPQRCQTICDLSAATCDLEGKICDLAQRHSGDPRYADLCRRADEDCRLAAEACQRCSP